MSLTPEQMLAVLSALPDPVFVLTESGRYVGVFGHSDLKYYHDGHELVGTSVYEVMPLETAQWVIDQIQNALTRGGLVKVEYELAASQVKGLDPDSGPDGTIWFEGHVQPFPGLIQGERAIIWVARNINARKRLEAELLRASQTDPLTRAANRRKLLNTLHENFVAFKRYGHPMSLIMFDIDHFKKLNDRFGHLAGDTVLRNLCDSCRLLLRESDLLARFGGEEFIVVLPSTPLPQALATAQRIRIDVPAAAALITGPEKKVNLSLGVSELLPQDSSYDQILRRADTALYMAKGNGRNRVETVVG